MTKKSEHKSRKGPNDAFESQEKEQCEQDLPGGLAIIRVSLVS